MRRALLALLLLLGGFVVPSGAAAPVPFVRRAVGDVDGEVVRTYAVPPGALLAGVTWRTGSLSVSVRSGGAWQPVEAGDDEPGTRPGTEPVPVARTSVLTLRLTGRASGVTADFAGAGSPRPSGEARALPRLGQVVTRAGWGADERLRSGRPRYAAVRSVIVHHTVTPNDYAPEEAAGYVRAVYAYHTRSRGYDDIAYNLLVDRFGTVYEGRAGDFARGVVGSHTAGHNTGALGVALLGNFDTASLPSEAAAALGRTGAWASERWSFDPRARGRVVGHRDHGATACPGRHAYAALPAVRADAWRRLAAVFAPPVVSGSPVHAPRPVTVSSTLDHAADWVATISVRGHVLATAAGYGRAVAVSWDGTLASGLPAPPGLTYEFLLTADDRVHGPSEPVSGTFEVGMPAL